MISEDFEVSRLAIPAVSVLISFLAYTSQYFFHHFQPAPLTLDEGWAINVFALCIWICYYRSCFVDPGRFDPKQKPAGPSRQETDQNTGRQRWCRRCEAYKPPRAHHCKTCKRLDQPEKNQNKTPRLQSVSASTYSSQMHPQNGSPLSMDVKLCLILHISSLFPLLVLCSVRNGLFGNPSVAACVYHLERTRYA